MDKSPVVYKRRRSGTPLKEISWNIEEVLVDPESEVSLLASDDAEGAENVTPVKKSRKNSYAEALPRRKTRSSAASLEDTSLKDVERTPQRKGKGVERTPPQKGKSVVEKTPTTRRRKHTDKESPIGQVVYSPIEFIMEKRAMFKEIDAFELESEEEDPRDDTAQHIAEALNSSEEEGVQQPNAQPEQSTKEMTGREDSGDNEEALGRDKSGDKEEEVNEEKAGDKDDR